MEVLRKRFLREEARSHRKPRHCAALDAKLAKSSSFSSQFCRRRELMQPFSPTWVCRNPCSRDSFIRDSFTRDLCKYGSPANEPEIRTSNSCNLLFCVVSKQTLKARAFFLLTVWKLCISCYLNINRILKYFLLYDCKNISRFLVYFAANFPSLAVAAAFYFSSTFIKDSPIYFVMIVARKCTWHKQWLGCYKL